MSCSDHITPPTGHMPAVYRCQNPSIHMKFLSLCAFEHELVSSEYLFLWIMKAGSSDDALMIISGILIVGKTEHT